jgi:type 1 fimbria pilin
MKSILVMLFTTCILSMFSISTVGAQTMAVGHVTAEVVESVSASSSAITGFDLKGGNSPALMAQTGNAGFDDENINLGDIKINSGSGVACNIVLKSATLSDGNGNGFILDPSAINTSQARPGRADGNQTLHLKGRAHLMHGQASGLYEGSYTMVFAYN